MTSERRGRAIQLAVLVLAVGLMVRSWLIEGLLAPLRVQGNSMAQTLLGPHRDLVCLRCGQSFAVGTGQAASPEWAFCPLCRERVRLADVLELPGDRVLIDKLSLLLRRPERWEVVAFRHPQRAGDVFVKRVVGRPGESVLLRHGDLYVDGRLQRKTLAQQRALAVPVPGASLAPAAGSGVPRRWQGRRPESGWRLERGGLVHPGSANDAMVDWCEYRHLRPAADGYQEAPVDDRSPYNQALPRRAEEVRAVADLMLSSQVQASGSGELLLEMTDGRRRFETRLDIRRRHYEAFADDRPDPIAGGRVDILPERPFRLDMSLFDRQFLLAIDGRPLVEYPYQRKTPPRPVSRPVAVGVAGPLRVRVDRLRLDRDVYYTRPTGLLGRWGVDKPYRLANEYFVLGDNSAHSDDSRSWPSGPGVPGHLLVGRPLVDCPATAAGWHGWQVRLSAPWRMRYIR